MTSELFIPLIDLFLCEIQSRLDPIITRYFITNKLSVYNSDLISILNIALSTDRFVRILMLQRSNFQFIPLRVVCSSG